MCKVNFLLFFIVQNSITELADDMNDTVGSVVEFITTVIPTKSSVTPARILEMTVKAVVDTVDNIPRQPDFVYDRSEKDDFAFVAGIMFFLCLGVYALIRVVGV